MSKAAAIIVAAGSGSRYGASAPKQFEMLGPWPVVRWSVEAFARHEGIDEIIVALPAGWSGDTKSLFGAHDVKMVEGGATRADTVRAALTQLTGDDRPVLVHDAARPGLQQQTITDLIAALESADGSAPALPVVDALKRGSEHLISVDRTDLHRVQTPQAFRLGKLRTALATAPQDMVDDLAAIELVGGRVNLVPGDERQMKLTLPGDRQILEALLGLSTGAASMRIGSGFDVHAFEAGHSVILCGVEIPHTAKLKGHSDADVAWHTLTDAILGALAMGDIGDHFPPSDPQWKGAASSVFLTHAATLAREAGYAIANADLTIICEAPKIGPHRNAMRQSTADLLGVQLDRISVKATTTERLGFTGRGEGIAAQATVCLHALPRTD